MRLVKRRCNHHDHKNPEWVRQNPEAEHRFPEGIFKADLDEERAARNIPSAPKYMSQARWLGCCPYHRKKDLETWASTIREWIEYNMKMFKESRGLRGLDPKDVGAAGLDPADYE